MLPSYGIAPRSGGGGRRGRLAGVAWTASLAVALLTLAAPSLVAQGGSVGGTVVEAKTLRPLAGAQVVVQGTSRGALTDANGRFLVTGLTGGEVTLHVVMLGYKAVDQAVAVGTLDVRIGLEEAAVALNEIVVTGQPGGTQKRAIGNSIAQVKAADVVATKDVQSVQDVINGRAPGVVVMPGTGMIGSGSRIRIRGTSTFSLSGDPLIYVDGVRVDNETGSGFSVQAFGSGVVSRLNDFSPEEIESIEILKGPAAATLYGTEAARGVINIITKKGAPGGTRYSFTVKQGANWFSDPQGRLPVNYWRDGSGTVQSLNLYQLNKDNGIDLFRTGNLQTYSAGVSGGASGVRYYVNGDLSRNDGAEPNNFRNQFSGRANVQIEPSEKFDLSANTGWITSRTGLSCEAGCGGAMWGLVFSTPHYLPQNCNFDGCGFYQGFRSGPPNLVDRAFTDHQMVGRFTGSVTMNYRPAKWITNRLTVGSDVTQEQNVEYLPYLTNDTSRYFWGPYYSNGYKVQTRRALTYNTFDYAGTLNLDVRPGLTSATSFGAQYYQKHIEFIGAEGDGFAGVGIQTVNAAATKPYASDDFVDNNTLGVYGQETVGLNDRLFLTGALRVDNNSAFGSSFNWVYYPKASLSWVLNEEPAVRAILPRFVDALKLRLAYGESGQQPVSFSALRTYSPVTGPNGTPSITPNTVGNPDLGPERGKEFEGGFDAGFLNDRLALEFTYYNSKTVDGILLRTVAPSSGFAGSQYVNAGAIRNQGVEIGLKADLLERKSFGWDATFNFSSNSGKVLQLAGGDTTIVLGDRQYKIGFEPNAWFREHVVSAQLDANGDAIKSTVMCDDGAGGVVPCYTGSVVTAPRVYLGRTTPGIEGSIGTGIRFLGNFRLSGLVDFKTNYKKFDNNLRARCQVFSLCQENMNPTQYDPVFIAQMQSNNTLKDWIINDASFAKLRELSLTYNMPSQVAQRIGAHSATLNVAARNLHTWTSYTGLDPEDMFLAGSPAYLEQDNLPQLMSFVTSININF